jgi:hypothetical protein
MSITRSFQAGPAFASWPRGGREVRDGGDLPLCRYLGNAPAMQTPNTPCEVGMESRALWQAHQHSSATA